MYNLDDYDFVELTNIIKSLGRGEVEIDPIDARTILGTNDLTHAMAILGILCELKVIDDYIICENWSLSILKE